MRGTVVEIIFENEETGFKICEIDVDGELVTIKGSLPFLYPVHCFARKSHTCHV